MRRSSRPPEGGGAGSWASLGSEVPQSEFHCLIVWAVITRPIFKFARINFQPRYTSTSEYGFTSSNTTPQHKMTIDWTHDV